jgi:hypothetical protein
MEQKEMNKMNQELLKILSNFEIKEEISEIQNIATGHINDTFRIITKGTNTKDYILQRINHLIFKDIEILTNNILRDTNKRRQIFLSNFQWKLLEAIQLYTR